MYSARIKWTLLTQIPVFVTGLKFRILTGINPDCASPITVILPRWIYFPPVVIFSNNMSSSLNIQGWKVLVFYLNSGIFLIKTFQNRPTGCKEIFNQLLKFSPAFIFMMMVECIWANFKVHWSISMWFFIYIDLAYAEEIPNTIVAELISNVNGPDLIKTT